MRKSVANAKAMASRGGSRVAAGQALSFLTIGQHGRHHSSRWILRGPETCSSNARHSVLRHLSLTALALAKSFPERPEEGDTALRLWPEPIVRHLLAVYRFVSHDLCAHAASRMACMPALPLPCRSQLLCRRIRLRASPTRRHHPTSPISLSPSSVWHHQVPSSGEPSYVCARSFRRSLFFTFLSGEPFSTMRPSARGCNMPMVYGLESKSRKEAQTRGHHRVRQRSGRGPGSSRSTC